MKSASAGVVEKMKDWKWLLWLQILLKMPSPHVDHVSQRFLPSLGAPFRKERPTPASGSDWSGRMGQGRTRGT